MQVIPEGWNAQLKIENVAFKKSPRLENLRNSFFYFFPELVIEQFCFSLYYNVISYFCLTFW